MDINCITVLQEFILLSANEGTSFTKTLLKESKNSNKNYEVPYWTLRFHYHLLEVGLWV